MIEETFPLKCSVEEFGQFIDGSKKHAAGWIGFYWGKPPEELRRSKTISRRHDAGLAGVVREEGEGVGEMTGGRAMRKKRKPHEERKPEDYMEAADNSLELAKVLAGQGGSATRTFWSAWPAATNWRTMTARRAASATT